MAKHPSNQTAQTIIQAALECLERDGLEGMTIRTIAEHAQVNIAAVNYHFGSKEALLNEVLALASRNAFMDVEQWLTAQTPAELRLQLEAFANHLLDGLANFPNTSRVVLHELIFAKQAGLQNDFDSFIHKLERHARVLHGKDAAWRVLQFMNGLIGFCLLPDAFLELGLDQARTRQRLLALLL
jgi:AcrR family transcriptional regulator